ncbi:hypothetical protein CVD28_00620 [Bacillus sp. M6-12]|uniref:hypothetical protein n=1 Tax=Bacillus sp. M6-12 TaxID=2054166 RepID=UPI000C78B852|nr:hypothetical protein [Bacillus sp. M6-12]PLS18936.1 hypothetical protein CVD28_00620 [Bacillus sp. M6-12]
MVKPRELAEILLRMADEDEDMEVKIEDKNGNVYEVGHVCQYDDGERYEIAISAIPLNKVPEKEKEEKVENQNGKGLTGWLSPEGEFSPCEYGEHYKLATEIVYGNNDLNRERVRIGHEKGTVIDGEEALKELLWIPMGVPKWGGQSDMDYLFISHLGRTEAQIKWFEENYENLSETQKEKLEEHINDYLELNN